MWLNINASPRNCGFFLRTAPPVVLVRLKECIFWLVSHTKCIEQIKQKNNSILPQILITYCLEIILPETLKFPVFRNVITYYISNRNAIAVMVLLLFYNGGASLFNIVAGLSGAPYNQ
jgi:hypothetical protein